MGAAATGASVATGCSPSAAGVVTVLAGTVGVAPPVAVTVSIVVVFVAVSTFAASGFFASSGKNFGSAHDQRPRRAIEITTARKILFSISGDRVPTSRIERVAACESLHAKPDAARDAVFFDGVHRIHRTRR